MKELNRILLKRKRKVLLPEDGGDFFGVGDEWCETILANFESLGFEPEEKLIYWLEGDRRDELVVFGLEVVPVLEEIRGKKCKFPGFPYQFGERVDTTTSLEEIGIGNEEDLLSILGDGTLTAQEKSDFRAGFEKGLKVPERVGREETAAWLSAVLFNLGRKEEIRTEWFRTSTGVLQFATALSGGDTSLVTNTRFKSFGNQERKFLMTLLAKVDTRDASQQRERWLRVGERIHPNSFKGEKYWVAREFFRKLRNNR